MANSSGPFECWGERFFGGETNLIKGFEVLVVYFDLGKNEKKYEGGRKNTRS